MAYQEAVTKNYHFFMQTDKAEKAFLTLPFRYFLKHKNEFINDVGSANNH